MAPEWETAETTEGKVYRVDVRDGVVFCESCGAQVSPGDRTCPACEYALRVERRTGDSREFALEY